ncbi:MAG: hypothetical protein ACXW32_17620 [Limisphaerales bacterium]
MSFDIKTQGNISRRTVAGHVIWKVQCVSSFGLRLVDYVEHDGGVHGKAEQIEIVVIEADGLNDPVVKGPKLFS